MPGEHPNALRLEIGHVLFVDIVGYSKLRISQQSDLLRDLNEVVRATHQVREADAEGKLIRLPTGDGMALVFRSSSEAALRCAIEIAGALKSRPDLPLRMGIHSGPVNEIADVNERTNIAGAGINMAQRVMDCGDAGHILLSKRVAEDLEHYDQWQPHLHDLGECEVKHGVRVQVVNFYTEELGNSALPERFGRLATKKNLPGAPGTAKRSHASRSVGIAAAALVLLGIAAWFLRHPSSSGTPNNAVVITSGSAPATPVPEKSIAVLPLENLSDDKKDAYFADGIQDDLLNSLEKIKELKVISRSSVMGYRDVTSRNLREIGQQLGVANVLEGSVRHAANRVLVNVALIYTTSERQVWAEHYDRTLTDSLTLQGELATEIATALRATLSPEEKARVEARPTENAEAYDLYLRAREYHTRPTGLLQDYQTAQRLYSEALALDPGFALAHARLSEALSYLYLNFQPTAEIQTRAHAEAEEAVRLSPDSGEGSLARALCLYWTEKNYDAALREMQVAAHLLPSSTEIDFYSGAIRRRQGRWREALASMKRAQIGDPRNSLIARETFLTECLLRDWPAAARDGARAVALAPELPMLQVENSYVDIWARGDLTSLRTALAAVPAGVDPDGEITLARFEAALFARDFAAAQHVIETGAPDTVITPFGVVLPKNYLLGCIALAHGETARAQPLLEAARPAMEADAQAFPLDAFRQAHLGLLYAFLGRKEDALRHGRHAVEVLPESKDAYFGPSVSGLLALIYARTGEVDQALALIDRLIKLPGPLSQVFEGSITQSDLRLRWQWDPLRKNPRFQKLLHEPEPRTIYR